MAHIYSFIEIVLRKQVLWLHVAERLLRNLTDDIKLINLKMFIIPAELQDLYDLSLISYNPQLTL